MFYFVFIFILFKILFAFYHLKLLKNRLVLQPPNLSDESEIINFKKIIQKELIIKNTHRMSFILFGIQKDIKTTDRNMIQIESEKNLNTNLFSIKDQSVLEKAFVNLLERARKIGENRPKPISKISEKLKNLKSQGTKYISMKEYHILFVEACRESCVHFTTEIFENITQLLHSKKKKKILLFFLK